MARFAAAFVLAAVMIATASAQFDYFGGFPGGFAAPRDPRENRGPVTFPVTQSGSETSGVRVGASGYGFVPPGAKGGIKKATRRQDSEEGGEETWMAMAAFQLAKMTERERLGLLSKAARRQAEAGRSQAEREAKRGHLGLKRRMRDSIRWAEALTSAAMRKAESSLLLLMEKWGFGNWRKF